MKTLLRNPIGIFAALFMLVALFVLPQTAQAKVFLSDGTDSGSPVGGGEGDPLDSNDFSSGGVDDIVHQRSIIPRDSAVVYYEIVSSSQTILLRIEFIGDVPVFSIYAASESELLMEASHDR